jgi:hypothetical protein
MIVRWERTKYHSDLDGHLTSSAYEIVAQDADSVVVRIPDSITDQPILVQIYFDGDDSYRLATRFSGFVEWFKRVK